MLIERDEQLALIDRWLDGDVPRAGQVLLLEGAVGAGKTEFLREVAERAARHDAVPLTATCSPGEHDLPFGVLSQLFDSPGLPAELRREASRVLRGLMDAAAAESMREAVERNRAKILYDLFLPLIELAAGTPLVMCVDDVVHADAASQECLLQLVRRLGPAPVLIVLAELSEPRRTHSPFHSELVRQSSFTSARLPSLSREGVGRVLARRLGEETFERAGKDSRGESAQEAAERIGDEFLAYSGGNPALLDALVKDEHQAGEVRQQGYGRALLTCLYRSEPVMLRVARAMAVHGDDSSAEDLAGLTAAAADTVERAVRTMTEAGLLREGRFRHPVVRPTVLDDLPEADREELNLRSARLLYGQGAPAAEVARHLILAGRVQESWAPWVLLEAAAQALLLDEVQVAVEYLDLAHKCCAYKEARWPILARLAQAEWQLNPSASARYLTDLTDAARERRLERRDVMLLVRQLLWLHRTREATELLALLRESAGKETAVAAPGAPTAYGSAAGTDELREMELWLASTYPPLADRQHGAAVPAGPEQTPASRGVNFWLQSVAALSGGLIHRQNGDTEEWAAHVLSQPDLSDNTPWVEEATLLALTALIYTGRPGTAANWCKSFDDRRSRRPSSMWQGILDAVEGEILLRKGDLAGAVKQARAALDQVPARGWGTAVGLPLGCLIMAHTRRGDFDAATALVTQTVPEEMFQSRYGLHYLHARGHYYLATNRTHAALADFLSCGDLMRNWGLDLPGIVPWRTSAAEAWLRQGNRDQAKRLVRDQLALPGVEDSVSRGLALRLLAGFSSAGQRPRLLSESADILEAADDNFELARTLAVLGRAHHALGKHRRSRMVIRRAWHVANMCKAVPLCQELLPDMSGLDENAADEERTSAVASLTNSERRIASMAVMGYTNREIAEKFFITPSTVEQHLTRVYRKLDIKNRQGLPDYLRADVV